MLYRLGYSSFLVLRIIRFVLLCGFAVVLGLQVSADPYAEPGDIELRHDIEFLADRGLISVPITTWPISWADLAVAVDSIEPSAAATPGVHATLKRLKERVSRNTTWGYVSGKYDVGLSDNRSKLRTFNNRPRGKVELGAELEYTGMTFASKLRVTVVDDSNDDQSIRLDGSYASFIAGNVNISAGLQDAWWGPGHAGSLILSNNARPVPTLSLRRNVASAFSSKWLNWIGPWTAVAFAGQLESDRFVSDAYLLGARVAIKPTRRLELGVSRTAQWGGEGRPETFESLVNLVIGRDNAGEGVDRAEEPGNQLAGFDVRYSAQWLRVPVTFYGQLIGEDEAGGFPSRYLGQGGMSTSWPLNFRRSTARVALEYSDTTCQFHESSKLFNCAYSNGIYQSGYRYRGASIGHSTDADSKQLALIMSINSLDRTSWQAIVRGGKLNRDDSIDLTHSVTASRLDFTDIDLQHTREYARGKLEMALGYQRAEQPTTGSTDDEIRLSVRWSSRFD